MEALLKLLEKAIESKLEVQSFLVCQGSGNLRQERSPQTGGQGPNKRSYGPTGTHLANGKSCNDGAPSSSPNPSKSPCA